MPLEPNQPARIDRDLSEELRDLFDLIGGTRSPAMLRTDVGVFLTTDVRDLVRERDKAIGRPLALQPAALDHEVEIAIIATTSAVLVESFSVSLAATGRTTVWAEAPVGTADFTQNTAKVWRDRRHRVSAPTAFLGTRQTLAAPTPPAVPILEVPAGLHVPIDLQFVLTPEEGLRSLIFRNAVREPYAVNLLWREIAP